MSGSIRFFVSVQGLSELIGRMKSLQAGKMAIFLSDAMKNSLVALNEAVPEYPDERFGQKYIRTERLGRSLGSGFGGGRQGRPDIFEVQVSGGAVEGRFGTRVGYAEYVIGEGTQAWMHAGRWWTVRTILNRAMKAISGLWNAVGERIAAYLNGR